VLPLKTDLFARIAALYPDDHKQSRLGGWCELDKALTLASLVVALRPKVSLEIGVWTGASAIPMAMAHHAIDFGALIAIDPWDPRVSIENEVAANVEWWGQQDHEAVYQKFLAELRGSRAQNYCTVQRRRSDDAMFPQVLDLIHIDGSHTMQAVKDVERYATRVRVGGVCVMDDIKWDGGGVTAACARLKELNFVELYPLGTGAVFQRV
jgi:predicted O-methyltransferase YrrM